MEGKIIFLAVLVLELGGVFSFYLSKGNQQFDVYKIKEDLKTHTLTITNPKPEKPTLREIIYYHIIETPYDQVKSQNNSLNYKNAEDNKLSKHTNPNNNDSKLNNVEGLIKISDDQLGYTTGSADITNDKYSISKNSISKEENLSVSEKSDAYISTNHGSNIINDKQSIDSSKNISGIKIMNTADNHSSTRHNDLGSNTDVETIKTTNVSSSLNATLSEKSADSNFFDINLASSQVISTDGVEISDNYSILNDFHFKDQNVNKINRDNKRTKSENSAFLHKELEPLKTKYIINSILNTVLLENITDSKINRENYTSNQFTSETFRGHTELKDNHGINKETKIIEHNEIKENSSNILKELDTMNIINKNSFERTDTVQYNQGSAPLGQEKKTSEINSKTTINDLNNDSETKYTKVSNQEINNIDENKTKVHYDNFNNISIQKQTTNKNIENNIDADMNFKTKTNKDKVIPLELTKTNRAYNDIIFKNILSNNYTVINKINKDTNEIKINTTNGIQMNEVKSNKNVEKYISANNTYYDNDHKICEQSKKIENIAISRHDLNSIEYKDKETITSNHKSSNISTDNSTQTTYKTDIEQINVIDNFNIVQRENITEVSVFSKLTNTAHNIKSLSTITEKTTNASDINTKYKNKTDEITNKKQKILLIEHTNGFLNDTDLSLATEVMHHTYINKTSRVNTKDSNTNLYNNTHIDKLSDTKHSANITELDNFGGKSNQSNKIYEFVIEKKNKTVVSNANDNTISVMENDKINHVNNMTTDNKIQNKIIIKQKHVIEERNNNIKNKAAKSFTHVYTKSDTIGISNDNEPVIYVYDVYDNPYDGKEGVNFKARQFINGHGYQYFYPYPEDQINVNQKTNEPKNYDTINTEEHLALSKSKGSILGTIVIPDDDLDPTGDNKVKLNKNTNKTVDLENSIKIRRIKRRIKTLMSVQEEMAPEDMYKDVMDKISERVRRSLKEGETYGMALTGGGGVVWNDFNEKFRTFPVGEHSDDVEVVNQERLRTNTNEQQNKDNVKAYYKNDVINMDGKDVSDNTQYVDGYNINTNDSEEDSIDELNEIKINEDYNNSKYVEKSLDEFNIVKNSDEDYYDKKPQEYEPFSYGNTYGMSLIGGRGNVWNDINGRIMSYQVDKPTSGSNISEEDEIINAKIAAFQSSLTGAPSIRELKKKEPIILKTSTSNFAPRDNMQNMLPDNDKKVSNRSTISMNKPTNEQRSKETQNVPVSYKETPAAETTENMSKFVDQADKLTGMSLSGNDGVVWTDLNGRRVSHHVGKEATSSDSITRINGDNKKIYAMIAQFKKSLNEVENSNTDNPKTPVPITEKPVVIKPLTEEPIFSETDPNDPTTQRPIVIGPTTDEVIITREPSTDQTPIVKSNTPKPENREENTETSYTKTPNNYIKTYGMSLTGDQGLVWNDLNGDRFSYHVGETVEEAKEIGSSQPTTSNPTESDRDESTQLINEIDQVLDEIDNILEDIAQETDKPKEDNYQNELKELIDIIKDVFAKESAKLDEKLKKLNDLNEKKSSKDKNTESNKGNSSQSVSVEELVNNDEFRKWLSDWLSSNTEHLMNQVDEYVKKEVEEQIEQYFTTHNRTEPVEIISEHSTEGEKNNESVVEDVSKRHKDCDNKKDKKESEIQIAATNVYGSSVGNKNVTNIFIFNVNKISDLDNNVMEPLINGTDGVYVFGNENKEPNSPVDLEELNEDADEATTEKPNDSENEKVTGTTPEIVTEKSTEETSDTEEKNSSEIIESEDKNVDEQKDNKSKENTEDSKETIEPTSSEEITDSDKPKENVDTQNSETDSNELTSGDSKEPEVNNKTENVSSETESNVVAESSEKSEESTFSAEKKSSEITEGGNVEELNEDADEATTEKPNESENEKVTDTTPEIVTEKSTEETSENPSNNIETEEKNSSEIIESEDKNDDEQKDNKSKGNTEDSKETIEPTSSEEITVSDKPKENVDTQNSETDSNELTSGDSKEPKVNDKTENVSSETESNVVAESSEKSEESTFSAEKKSSEITEGSNEDELKEENERISLEDNTSDISNESEIENEAPTESENDK